MTHALLLHGFAWIIAIGAGIWMYTPGFAIADKLMKIPPLKMLHTWAKNKFYFDELYDVFVVAITKAVAGVFSLFDKYIVDGMVNFAGLLARCVANLVGVIDAKGVDGAVNGAAAFAQTSGSLLGRSHSGRIRGYVTILLGSVCLIGMVVIAVVLVVSSK